MGRLWWAPHRSLLSSDGEGCEGRGVGTVTWHGSGMSERRGEGLAYILDAG